MRNENWKGKLIDVSTLALALLAHATFVFVRTLKPGELVSQIASDTVNEAPLNLLPQFGNGLPSHRALEGIDSSVVLVMNCPSGLPFSLNTNSL